MTVADIDIWRAANLMLKQHGEDAEIAASQRADELLARGDVEGQIVWKRIVAAIAELRRGQRKPQEALN